MKIAVVTSLKNQETIVIAANLKKISKQQNVVKS